MGESVDRLFAKLSRIIVIELDEVRREEPEREPVGGRWQRVESDGGPEMYETDEEPNEKAVVESDGVYELYGHEGSFESPDEAMEAADMEMYEAEGEPTCDCGHGIGHHVEGMCDMDECGCGVYDPAGEPMMMSRVDRLALKLSKIWIPPHMSVRGGKPFKVDGYWRRGDLKDLTPRELAAVTRPARDHAIAADKPKMPRDPNSDAKSVLKEILVGDEGEARKLEIKKLIDYANDYEMVGSDYTDEVWPKDPQAIMGWEEDDSPEARPSEIYAFDGFDHVSIYRSGPSKWMAERRQIGNKINKITAKRYNTGIEAIEAIRRGEV